MGIAIRHEVFMNLVLGAFTDIGTPNTLEMFKGVIKELSFCG